MDGLTSLLGQYEFINFQQDIDRLATRSAESGQISEYYLALLPRLGNFRFVQGIPKGRVQA